MLTVKRVRGFDRGAIDLNAKAGTIRHGNLAALNLQGFSGQRLTILPNPVSVYRSNPFRARPRLHA